MHKRTAAAVVVAFFLGGAVGAVGLLTKQALDFSRVAALAPHPAWTEIDWPFLVDEWGKGKAFRCAASNCGTEVHLYLRPKIGFCNCTTGVSDDAELERLSDFALMGSRISNLRDGRPVTIGWMKGRSRAYEFTGAARGGKSGLSIAFNDKCDAVVATVVAGHDDPDAIESAAIGFLNEKPILQWVEGALGL
jgi:hypothetical protein